jgi:UDP-N-acetyl-2-amino-2-deoxyglucuronate dehydrogenase
MKNFALTGAAGYIAPRHMKAIKETGNRLTAILDPHDAVGIIDSYFPDASYFKEFERFERHLDKARRHNSSEKIDYLSICSPNYLHDAHIRLAMRLGVDAICEKPLVLNPWNLDLLEELEEESGKRIYNVLQLRTHPALIEMKNKIDSQKVNKKYNVELTYITSRGKWYLYSWKGDVSKSGGLATNIGIHFFDMLIWFFGEVVSCETHYSSPTKICGFLELKNANVKWYLSIDKNDLPLEIVNNGKLTYRSIKINEEKLEFTEGFTNLHTVLYEKVLRGEGFFIKDARPSIELAYRIRNSIVNLNLERAHPFITKTREK